MRRFASHGWHEVLLPDGARYFSNPDLRIITDVDLRNAERLDVITTFLDGCEPETLPQPEWELWLRDARESTSAAFLVKAWVHHKARMVLFERPSSDPGEIMNKDIDSKLLRVYVRRSFLVLMTRQSQTWSTSTGHSWCPTPLMRHSHQNLSPKPLTS